ncbi:hypothetical protein HXX76_007121 [Chlamydomonas incerta]|uniref:Uncharacterized protein n=1 Tax=Chlamydomonas incerta TaxID=51695 RepID=A0A835W4X2_CHLIN|nr:hypothetical protein HXX76_007121 [Chlamydomonas incerta]|eukprot:KAG2435926.1 hypothetical protein HXX76_007121 [Chlamydomonas incerta]
MYTLELHPTCLRMTAPYNDCCTHVRVETRELPLAAIARVTLSCNDMLAVYGLDQLNVWTASNTEESGPELAIAWLARPLQARDAILNAVQLLRQLEHEHGGGAAGPVNGQQLCINTSSSLRLDLQLPTAANVPPVRASATGLDGATAAGERPKLGWSGKGGVGSSSLRSDRDRDSGGSSSLLSHSSSEVTAAATSELAAFYLQRSLREMALPQPPAQPPAQQQQQVGAPGAGGQVQWMQQLAAAPLQGPHLDLHVHHYHHHLHLHQQHQQHQLPDVGPACVLSAEQQYLELMAAAGAEQALVALQAANLAHAHMLSMSRRAQGVGEGAPLPPLLPCLLSPALQQQQQQQHSHGYHGYPTAALLAAGEDEPPPQPQRAQREHDPELFGAAALGLALRPLRVPPHRPVWPTGRLPLKSHHRPIAAPADGTAADSSAPPTVLAMPPQAMIVSR